MITFDNYVRVKSPEEAYSLNQNIKNVIGGGMMWLHLSNAHYDTYIDLCDLGLDKIEEQDDCFKMGAMVSLSQLENNASLRECYGSAFADCLKHIVGVQFRNCATLGGSICAKLAFSDIITLLLPLNPTLVFAGQGEISLEDFLNNRSQRDVLLHVILPKRKVKMVFESVRKTYTDLPVINMCAVKDENGLKMAVGARPAMAALVKKDEEPVFGSNARGSKEYRQHLYKVLCGRIEKKMEK